MDLNVRCGRSVNRPLFICIQYFAVVQHLIVYFKNQILK